MCRLGPAAHYSNKESISPSLSQLIVMQNKDVKHLKTSSDLRVGSMLQLLIAET